jgi:protein TonB
MRAQTFEDPTRLNPARTVAMATAIAVHIGAVLFLIAPARPEAQAQLEDRSSYDVIIIEPPMAPPPPPPVKEPDPPPPIPTRIPPPVRPPVPSQPTTHSEPATSDSSEILSDEPVSDPVMPTPPGDTFTEARADVQYGGGVRVRYPSISIRRKEQGEVQLRVLVGIDGTPRQVELARTSGFGNLDAAAKKTVMNWRFVPAERNGSAVEAWVIVPIRFNLSEA